MSRTGDVYRNPVTGECAVVRLGTDESGGGHTLVDLHVEPGGAVAGEHVHETIVEAFEVIAGRIGFRVGGHTEVAGAGRRVEVPVGVPHDWWNAGDEPAHTLVELHGSAVSLDRFEQALITGFGLAHEGKVDAKGRPWPLQGAVMAHEFTDVLRFTSPPRIVQRVLFPLLAALGRARGYRATYPHHRGLVVTPREAAAAR